LNKPEEIRCENMKIIDLTHLFGKDTPSYPGDPRTRLSQIKSLERDGYNLNL